VVEKENNVPKSSGLFPTEETKALAPQSIYAITKRTQEDLALAVGRSYALPITVLCFFNIYGPRQSLSNPYTGVAKIFALAIASGKSPLIYEDGLQIRDFIHVSDVVEANLLALNNPRADGHAFNIGTERPFSVAELARYLAAKYCPFLPLFPSGQFRAGDVRHCFADISKARTLLGFEPGTLLPRGLEDLLPISVEGKAIPSSIADTELRKRGLIR
jgi:dTDP-L-rhamnose 4-epimerase